MRTLPQIHEVSDEDGATATPHRPPSEIRELGAASDASADAELNSLLVNAEEPASGVVLSASELREGSPPIGQGEDPPASRRTFSGTVPGAAGDQSVPVARVAISRASATDESTVTRVLGVCLRLAPSLMGAGDAYVTLTLPSGKVVFEGVVLPSGVLMIDVYVPTDAAELRVLVEAGTKYRNATLRFGDAPGVAHELR